MRVPCVLVPGGFLSCPCGIGVVLVSFLCLLALPLRAPALTFLTFPPSTFLAAGVFLFPLEKN